MARSALGTSEANVNDRLSLRARAKEFAKVVSELNLPRVKPTRSLSVESWDQPNGWWAQVATFRRFNIGISLDQALWPHVHPAPKSRTFWYGFWGSDQNRIRELSCSMPLYMQPQFIVGDEFLSDTEVSIADIQRPVLEVAKSEVYFGIYDYTKPVLVPQLDMQRAADFIKTSVLSYEELISRTPRIPASARSAAEPYSRFINTRTEKINPQHIKLQQRFEVFIKAQSSNTDVSSDQAGVDVRYRSNGQLVLAEVKPSCTRNEIRQAIGQLFDYEQNCDHGSVSLLIVLQHKPTERDASLAMTNRCGIAYPEGSGFVIKPSKPG